MYAHEVAKALNALHSSKIITLTAKDHAALIVAGENLLILVATLLTKKTSITDVSFLSADKSKLKPASNDPEIAENSKITISGKSNS